VVGLEQWAEIRRFCFVSGCRSRRSADAPATAMNTIRRALRSRALAFSVTLDAVGIPARRPRCEPSVARS
jgi:hypothetical protein